MKLMEPGKLNFLSRYVRAERCAWNGKGSFSAKIEQPLATGWYLIWLRQKAPTAGWMARLRMRGSSVSTEVLIAKPFTWNFFGLKLGVFFLPGGRRA